MHLWSIEASRLTEFLEKRRTAKELMRQPPVPKAKAMPRRVSSGSARGGDVMVIPIVGVMMRNPDEIDQYFGATSTDKITQAVKDATTDKSVGSIVLRVDSPGGSVEGLYELTEAVRLAARSKRVIGAIDGMAASAAYMAIAHATTIVARHADLVGSIGTILVVYDYSKLVDKAGVRVVPITTGEYKATGYFGTELTKTQQAHLQELVDDYFRDFQSAVVRGRRLGLPDWAAVSDGRVFRANEAKRRGLIDSIAVSVEEVIQAATPAGQIAASRGQLSLLRSKEMRRRMKESSRKFEGAMNLYRTVDAHDPPARYPSTFDNARTVSQNKQDGRRNGR